MEEDELCGGKEGIEKGDAERIFGSLLDKRHPRRPLLYLCHRVTVTIA